MQMLCTRLTKAAMQALQIRQKQRLAEEKEKRTQDAIQGLKDKVFKNLSEAACHFGISKTQFRTGERGHMDLH